MNQKRFEYQNKDIPFLKKDTICRFVFMALFAIVFFSQFAIIVYSRFNGETTTMAIVFSAIVMIFSLLLCIICLAFALKNIKLIKAIKQFGNVVSSVSVLPSMQKRSFIRLYSLLTQIIAVVLLVVCASITTYCVLKYIHFAELSPYLPLLFLVTVMGLNSVYHVEHEIKLTKNVKEFNGIY